MNRTIIAAVMLLTFVSCDKESDEMTEVDRKQISQELFDINPIPSVVTEPYIITTTHVNLSKLPKGLTGEYCTQDLNFEELNMSLSSLQGDISTGQTTFGMKHFGLRNHTTGSYEVKLVAKYDGKDKKDLYEAEPITFKVEIDEERLAETQPLTERLTTNEVTLEAQMNIASAYSDRFDYHIYCDTLQDYDLWRNRLMSRCETTTDGQAHVTYKRLRFGSRYYYMACIHNKDKYYQREECYYGKVMTFDVPPMEAEVITGDAPAEIDMEWLKLPFSIKGINVDTKSLSGGICYSAVNHEPTLQDAHEEFFNTNGTGATHCRDLKPNTTYYYRAFAKYSYSVPPTDTDCTIIYGDVKTFTTPSR